MTPPAAVIGGTMAQLTDSLGRTMRWLDRAENMADARRVRLTAWS